MKSTIKHFAVLVMGVLVIFSISIQGQTGRINRELGGDGNMVIEMRRTPSKT